MATYVPRAGGAPGPALPEVGQQIDGGRTDRGAAIQQIAKKRDEEAEVAAYHNDAANLAEQIQLKHTMRRGANARGAVEDAVKEYNEGIADLRKNLRSRAAYVAADGMDDMFSSGLMSKVASHQTQQIYEWQVDSHSNVISTQARLVTQGKDINEAFKMTDAAASALAELQGVDAENIKTGARSSLVVAKVQFILDDPAGDPSEAQKIIDDHGDQLTVEDRTKVMRLMGTRGLEQEADIFARNNLNDDGTNLVSVQQSIDARSDWTEAKKQVFKQAVNDRNSDLFIAKKNQVNAAVAALDDRASQLGKKNIWQAYKSGDRQSVALWNSLPSSEREKIRLSDPGQSAWDAAIKQQSATDAANALASRRLDRIAVFANPEGYVRLRSSIANGTASYSDVVATAGELRKRGFNLEANEILAQFKRRVEAGAYGKAAGDTSMQAYGVNEADLARATKAVFNRDTALVGSSNPARAKFNALTAPGGGLHVSDDDGGSAVRGEILRQVEAESNMYIRERLRQRKQSGQPVDGKFVASVVDDARRYASERLEWMAQKTDGKKNWRLQTLDVEDLQEYKIDPDSTTEMTPQDVQAAQDAVEFMRGGRLVSGSYTPSGMPTDFDSQGRPIPAGDRTLVNTASIDQNRMGKILFAVHIGRKDLLEHHLQGTGMSADDFLRWFMLMKNPAFRSTPYYLDELRETRAQQRIDQAEEQDRQSRIDALEF